MVNKDQMKELIVSTLKAMGSKYASKDAVSLVWSTGLVESGYKYIRQMGSGPARGFFQIEPKTCVSQVENYIKYRKKLGYRLSSISDTPGSLWGSADMERWDSVLESNIIAGIIHCRLKYWRAPEAMPKTIDGYASYWKKHYNTLKGKGEVKDFLDKVGKYADFL